MRLQSWFVGSFEAHTHLCVDVASNALTSSKLVSEYGLDITVANILT